MGLIEYLIEKFRPEMPVQQGILDKEVEFNNQSPSRESWVLNEYMLLCEGDLKDLKKHPDFDTSQYDYFFSKYKAPPGKKGPCKKVKVSVPVSSDKNSDMKSLERKLKLDLHSRNCRAGVFYETYEKNGLLYGEAIPATIDGE